ncbi:2-keto-4-pentenoate hydratase [Streptomyces canus]|uniref:2-keto-4-pentenoate hydratase n=1 Tax=Streptomyces canus TaxID=58343 RepID=UPI00036E88AA|nr:2-keto-4-pentenoate hydratase [Streptomyces canus]
MDTETRSEAVRALLRAHRTGKPIDPLTERFPGLDVADAYAIQAASVEQRVRDGAVIHGYKVGLTSPALRRRLDVDQPNFGQLTDTMFHPESQLIDPSAFVAPRVEPQIAFALGKPLKGPGITVPEAAAAVAWVMPALEIVDSRIRDWKVTLVDTIADNASSGGVVLGSTLVPPSGLDMRRTGGVLYHNGGIAGTGALGMVLGSPLNSLVWLANTLGAQGVALRAGQVVLPGPVTADVPVAAGDVVTATFASLGSVTARFADDTDTFG